VDPNSDNGEHGEHGVAVHHHLHHQDTSTTEGPPSHQQWLLNQNMVSYYNTLAMFPSHPAHHHPAHRQTHPGAAAAAAYFAAGYGGYPAPQHQPFNIGTPPHHTHYAHHPHHQFAAAVQAAATQAHHASSSGSPGPTGLGDLAACNGGNNSSSLGLTPSPGLDNPCSSPPSKYNYTSSVIISFIV
jgi:hypothetical protein